LAAVKDQPQPVEELALTGIAPVSVPPGSARAESNTGSELRWLARGAVPQAGNNHPSAGPLELANLSNVAAAPVTSSAPMLTMDPTPQFRPHTSTSNASPTLAIPVAEVEGLDESPKKILASLVSSQIIAERPGSTTSGRAIGSIDAPPGWQAIGQELSQRIAGCEALLNRKAYYSAREEADAAMLYLVRVLDLLSNRYASEPAWYAARKAMHEAEDFSTAQRLTSDSDFLRRIILSHETPVLKDADASALAPLAAAQHYRLYAENKLIEAAEGHPWAAEIAYALGRTYQAQADVSEDGSQQMLRWRAVTLYRGARSIAPYNSMATNQLGYVLLQMDRPIDARDALVDSLNSSPSLAAYDNLIEASRRLGDTATGNWARQQSAAWRSSLPPESNVPAVVEVDPRTFAALSPYAVGPTAQPSGPTAQPYRTATNPAIPNHNY